MQRSVMIVSAGAMQIPAIRTAKELGFHVVASDRNPEAAGFAYADERLVVDTKDVEAHLQYVRENQARLNIVGVFAGADVAITVAAITEALGLPGVSLEVARTSNNKAMMKRRWLADGVPTPDSVEVSTLEDAHRALTRVGLPAMIKAIDSAASRGSKKIISQSELGDALDDAKRHSSTGTALVEEFVQGDEQSVETIVFGGKHYRFGIVDRHFGYQPYAIETGHTNPTHLSSEVQEEIYEVVRRAADSLGIAFGPAKADMILTPKGPMILEMPARLSGGWHSQYTTPLATGLDPIRVALRLATGQSVDERDTVARLRRTCVCKAVFPSPGRVTRIAGVEEALRLPGVERVILTVGEGDEVVPYKNCAHRVCYIIAVGDTRQEADARWAEAASTVRIETTSVVDSTEA